MLTSVLQGVFIANKSNTKLLHERVSARGKNGCSTGRKMY